MATGISLNSAWNQKARAGYLRGANLLLRRSVFTDRDHDDFYMRRDFFFGSPVTLSVSDDFTEPADTDIENHNPGSWVAHVSGANVDVIGATDKATDISASNGNRYRNTFDLQSDEMDISADFVTSGTPGEFVFIGLLGRCGNETVASGPGAKYAQFDYEFSSQKYTLYDGVAGYVETAGTEAWPGGTVTLKFEIRKGSMKGYANGVLKLTLNTSGLSGNTRAGFLLGNFSGSAQRTTIDNFSATTPINVPASSDEADTLSFTEGQSFQTDDTTGETLGFTEGQSLQAQSSQNEAVSITEAQSFEASRASVEVVSFTEGASLQAQQQSGETVGFTEGFTFANQTANNDTVGFTEGASFLLQGSANENLSFTEALDRTARFDLQYQLFDENGNPLTDGEGNPLYENSDAIRENIVFTDGSALSTGTAGGETVSFAENISLENAKITNESLAFSEQSAFEASRSQNETVGFAEAFSGQTSDAAGETFAFNEGQSFQAQSSGGETVGFAEAASLQAQKSSIEVVTFTEGQSIYGQAGSGETLGFTEGFSFVTSITQAETLPLGDTPSNDFGGSPSGVTVQDGLGFSESASFALFWAINEALSFTDARSLSSGIAAGETLAISEGRAAAASGAGAGDTLTISEAMSFALALAVSDALAFGEDESGGASLGAGETLSFIEAAAFYTTLEAGEQLAFVDRFGNREYNSNTGIAPTSGNTGKRRTDFNRGISKTRFK